MKKIILAILVLAVIAGCTQTNEAFVGTGMSIMKSPNCGCCGIYSGYADDAGFDVEIQDRRNMDQIKEQYNIPSHVQSCHTSVVGDYFVEGHVPTEAIEKLMTEQPDIAGIALPGMPSGTPGMPGAKTSTWTIYAVHHDGSTSVFMKM